MAGKVASDSSYAWASELRIFGERQLQKKGPENFWLRPKVSADKTKMNIDASGKNLTTTPKYEATVSATSATQQLDGGDVSATRTY